MPTRTPVKRLAAIVLVVQFLAAFGAARSIVLCEGPAGHVAVEAADAASRCRESSAALADVDSGEASLMADPACVDTPLATAAADPGASPTRPLALSLPTSLPLALAPAMPAAYARPGIEARAGAARVLRSVVLTI